MTGFSFSTVANIICAPGALAELPVCIERLGVRRPLLVSDAGLVSVGLVDSAVKVLDAAGLSPSLFTAVEADPSEAVVLAAAAQAEREGVDGVIGLGGGSSMDVAKLVALLRGGEQPLAEVYGVDLARGPRLPLVQIPTTAGTGSEVTAVAIVTTGETTKAGVVSPVLLADWAILDPELTLGLPPAITASTGIDAMVHAIEAYTSRHRKNPLSDHLAVKALQLMSTNILRACESPGDVEARQAMLLGAMLAGQAFANAPVAAVHALAYPLGGHFHVPHGLSNSLVLPHVLRFNVAAAAAEYAELAASTFGIAEADAGVATQRFIERLEQLIGELGVQTRLREVGVGEADLDRLADDAMLQTRLLVNNPRELSRADALNIYREAY